MSPLSPRRSVGLRRRRRWAWLFALGGCSMFGSDSSAGGRVAPPSDSTLQQLLQYGSSQPPQLTPR